MERTEAEPGPAGHDSPAGAAAYAALLERLERESTPGKVRLLRYWLSLRSDGLPSYRRFDPLDIPDLLGDLAVIDVERPAMRFRFRLHGTRVAEIRGKDLTGLYVGDPDVFPPDLNELYLRSYQAVADSCEPAFNVVPYALQRRSVGHYHRLLLPFTDGGGQCDKIVLSFESVPLPKT